MHAKQHPDQRPWAIQKLLLLEEQFHPLNLMSGQQSLAEGPDLSLDNRLGQQQPQVTAAAAFLLRAADARRSAQEEPRRSAVGVGPRADASHRIDGGQASLTVAITLQGQNLFSQYPVVHEWRLPLYHLLGGQRQA